MAVSSALTLIQRTTVGGIFERERGPMNGGGGVGGDAAPPSLRPMML
jgi:hypothetical protein